MNTLATAADAGHLDDVRRLIAEESVAQGDKDLALARACCNGHLEIAQILLDAGADPNGQYQTKGGAFNYGPIILASCELLNPDGLSFLLDNGADPNGNPADSPHTQSATPLEMVQTTYHKDGANKARCIELLHAADAKQAAD